VSRIRNTHHVLRVPHLLCELWNGHFPVLLGASRGQGSESHHEEMKTGECNQIHRKLPQVRVQLPRKSQAACHSTHGRGD
jgi:hypothetical protein